MVRNLRSEMNSRVECREDMGKGRLVVFQQDDGDMIVQILQDPEEFRRGHGQYGPSVEFCIPGTGGGHSAHTHEALVQLMKAMQLDVGEEK